MNLCASDIAWPLEREEEAFAILQESGLERIELAPTRRWSDLQNVPEGEPDKLAEKLKAFGLRPAAFQAVLFGKPELTVFGEQQRQCLEYLKAVTELAAKLGATRIVFGSPKNRQRGSMPEEEAESRAVEFFSELGDHAARHGVMHCLEANPPEYHCDFMTRIHEAAAIVEKVNSPGIGLQFDAGGIRISNDDPVDVIPRFGPQIKHYHCSMPYLEEPEDGMAEFHQSCARELRKLGYRENVSLEMRTPAEDPLERLRTALLRLQAWYG